MVEWDCSWSWRLDLNLLLRRVLCLQVRNSWGTYWGELGFFKVERGVNALQVGFLQLMLSGWHGQHGLPLSWVAPVSSADVPGDFAGKLKETSQEQSIAGQAALLVLMHGLCERWGECGTCRTSSCLTVVDVGQLL
jgi:hypothetical protein